MPEDIFHSDDQHKRLSMKIKNDIFYEMSVYSQSNSNLFYIIYIACAVIMGVLSFTFLLLGGTANMIMFVFALILGLLCGLFYYMAQRTRIEYDYTLTNGTLDIAKIINDRSRKKLLSLDVSTIIEMKPITSESFQRYFEDNSLKKANMFVNKGTHLYYMLFVKDEKKAVVVFEPNQQLVEYMKIFNPNNIIA